MIEQKKANVHNNPSKSKRFKSENTLKVREKLTFELFLLYQKKLIQCEFLDGY